MKKRLTEIRGCGIVGTRDEILALFFMLKMNGELKEYVEVAKCVQKSLWLALSASSVTTILPRKRRTIPRGWKFGSIADFAESTQYTKKQNKFLGNKIVSIVFWKQNNFRLSGWKWKGVV